MKLENSKVKVEILYILCGVSFGIFLNSAAMTNIVKIIASEYTLSFDKVGVMLSLYSLFYGTTALFSTFFNRKLSKKRNLLIAVAMYGILNYLVYLSSNIKFIIYCRAFSGIFASQIIPTALLYLSSVRKNRGKKVGWLFSFNSISSLTGIVISGFIYWKYMFLISAFISSLNIVIIYFFLDEDKRGEAEAGESNILYIGQQYLRILFGKEHFITFCCIFLNCFFLSGIFSYLGFYLDLEYGVNEKIVALVLTCSIFGGIMGNMVSGYFIDKSKSLYIIGAGGLLISLSLMLISLNVSLLIFPLLITIVNVGRTFIHSVLVNRLLNGKRLVKEYSTSLNSFIVFSANSIGIIFFTFLLKYINYNSYLLFVSLAYVGGLLTLLIRIFRDNYLRSIIS